MANIKAKIIEFDPSQHSVVVRYYSDICTEEYLAMKNPEGVILRREDGTPQRCITDRNVNIWEVPAPQGGALMEYIFKNSPPNVEWFELQEKIVDPQSDTSLGTVATLVGKEHTFVRPEMRPIVMPEPPPGPAVTNLPGTPETARPITPTEGPRPIELRRKRPPQVLIKTLEI